MALKYGPPHVLVTDQGSEYTAEVTCAMAHYLGIDHAFAPAYRHNVVAQPERFTRFLKDILATYIQDDHTNWIDFLQTAV